MVSKHIYVQEIVAMMKNHDISLSDIENELKSQDNLDENQANRKFDLCCIVNCKVSRVSYDFAVNNNLIIVGIFLDSSPYYILADENTNIKRIDASTEFLPSIDDWKRINKLRKQLNEILKSFGKPEICGDYYARSNQPEYGGLHNWIVSIKNSNSDELPHNYFNMDCLAKTRYCYTFEK